jgi:hypothetical protein
MARKSTTPSSEIAMRAAKFRIVSNFALALSCR